MVQSRKLWLLLVVYLLVCELVLRSWLTTVVEVGKFEVGIESVQVESEELRGIYVKGEYADVCEICERTFKDTHCEIVCGRFKIAATSYYVMSILELSVLVLSILHLYGVSFGCNCFKSKNLHLVHYLPLPFSLLSLFLYLLLSGLLTSTEKIRPGFVLILGPPAVLVTALGLFCFLRKEISGRNEELRGNTELSQEF